MTELETLVSDALHARGDAVHPHETTLRARRPSRWLPPTIAAAVIVLLAAGSAVLATRHTSGAQPAGGSANFVGYRWRLVTIDDNHGHLALPPSTKAAVAFADDGTMTGSDTVHALQAGYRLVPNGYEPSALISSANGLAGPVPATVGRTLGAMDSCFSTASGGRLELQQISPAIRASVEGHQLVLRTAVAVLTFVRAGPA